MHKIKPAKSKTIRVSLKQWLLSSRGPWSPIEKMMEARSLNPSKKKKKCTHNFAHNYRSPFIDFFNALQIHGSPCILSRLMTTPLVPEDATWGRRAKSYRPTVESPIPALAICSSLLVLITIPNLEWGVDVTDAESDFKPFKFSWTQSRYVMLMATSGTTVSECLPRNEADRV